MQHQARDRSSARMIDLCAGMFQDAKIVEQACTALTRIATCFSHYPGHLDTLCNSGLVGNAVNLVRYPSSTVISAATQSPAKRTPGFSQLTHFWGVCLQERMACFLCIMSRFLTGHRRSPGASKCFSETIVLPMQFLSYFLLTLS